MESLDTFFNNTTSQFYVVLTGTSSFLSGVMMFRFMGWVEAADLIEKGLSGAIAAKTVTYDFERLMEGATLLGSEAFADAIISHM